MGHNFVKNQWIETKLKLDMYFCMAKQCTKYQMISVSREKKGAENCKIPQGAQLFQNWLIATIFELDLYVIDIEPRAKFQCNSCAHSG
jgi:hypothetical protein